MERINAMDVRSKRLPKRISLTLTVNVTIDELTTLIHDQIWLSEDRVRWKEVTAQLNRSQINEMMSEKASIDPHYNIDGKEEYWAEAWGAINKRLKELYRGK